MDDINEKLKGLPEEERKVALEILKQYSESGKSELYESLKYADYDEIPVDIHTFLHDKKYLGAALYDPDGRFTLFPYWETKLEEIFPDNVTTRYNTIVFTGAIGLGKSTIAVICLLYLLYRLLCLKDPYLYYGLQPIDKISISLMNITLENAKGVALDKMNQMLLSSEWFMAHGEMKGISNLEYIPQKHIELITASSNNQVIGRAIFCLDGDSVIKTTVGDYTLKSLVDENINVVSIDNAGNEVVSNTCTVKPTIVTDEEYEIELADNTIIKCTGDHLLMLKDGTYKAAKDLTLDDELMDKPMSSYDIFISDIIKERGQWGIKNEYFEGHHILPRCLGGEGRTKDKHPNIIRLYPEEHYLAHKLLLEKYPGVKQLEFAFHMMNIQNVKKYKLPEVEYAEAKHWISENYKNRQFSAETRRKMSLKAKGRADSISAMRKGKVAITNGIDCRYIEKDASVPDGWHYGTSSVGHHPKHTTHKKHVLKDREAFRKQKSDLSSGSRNGMYGKGYKLAGGKNGKAKTRYFFEDKVFECRKELAEYIVSAGINTRVTEATLRAIESGKYGQLFKNRYQYIIDNMRWEAKNAN